MPKVKYVRNSEKLGETEERVKISGIGAAADGSGSSPLPSSSTNSQDSDDYGDRIITTKTKRQLVDENAALKRRIHALEKEGFESKADCADASAPSESACVEEATREKDQGVDSDKDV